FHQSRIAITHANKSITSFGDVRIWFGNVSFGKIPPITKALVLVKSMGLEVVLAFLNWKMAKNMTITAAPNKNHIKPS
ncbi:MAG: hypothetical protein AAGD88_16035, partial [Bacteroidota bacterium]